MVIVFVVTGILALILSYFGYNQYKARKELDRNNEVRREVAHLDGEIDQLLEQIDDEKEKISEMKKIYEKKLGRELTDEELSAFFNSRYNKQ